MDLERYKCDIDMVDSALETLDITLSNQGIVVFASGFLDDDRNLMSEDSFFLVK